MKLLMVFIHLFLSGLLFAVEVTLLDEDAIEVDYEGGYLESSSDLVNWIRVENPKGGPVIESLEEERLFFRVELYPEKDTILVIAFTGQSNNLHIARNVPPYSSELIPISFWNVSGIGSTEGVVRKFGSITEGVRENVPVGAVWEFSQRLLQSTWRAGRVDRFAVVQTGAGGRPSSEWSNLGFVRGREFTAGVDGLIIELGQKLNSSGYLHAVVINQGEREAATGVDWARNWSDFMSQVRQRYGAQVQFYVVTLNGLNLMPRQETQEPNWTLTRERQLSVASDSGEPGSQEQTYLFDTNVLGGSQNTELFSRDNNVHYSNEGMEQIGVGVYSLFQEVNGID